MTPQLSIVIVNWNAGKLLLRCVESVVNSGISAPFEIVIVDNASSDDSLELLKASELCGSLVSSGQLRIILNTKNLGFGPANNQAFAITTAPFAFLLNPDAEVMPGAIERLLETIRSDTRIGGCGPKLLNADNSTQINVYFNPPRAWHTLLWQLKLYHMFPPGLRGELLLGRHWSHNRKRDVPMITGAAFLVRREVIETVGGFNEGFHMYAEDNEWCWRITKAGWRLVFDPSAVVVHCGGHSSDQRWSKEEKLRVQLESGFKFEHLALSKWNLIANQIANYLAVSLQIAARRMRGIKVPELTIIKQIHSQNLKRSFAHRKRSESIDTKNDSTRRGV